MGVGIATGIICAFTDMPNPAGLGALAAIMNFIPIIGPIVMFVVLLAVGIITASTLGAGLIAAACFTVVAFIEGHFVTPMIIGRTSRSQRAGGLYRPRLLDMAVGTDGALSCLPPADCRARPQRTSDAGEGYAAPRSLVSTNGTFPVTGAFSQQEIGFQELFDVEHRRRRRDEDHD